MGRGMLSPREAAAHSRYLDPPALDDRPCPDCEKKKARERFIEAVRDAIGEAVGTAGIVEILNPSDVYLDMVRSIADRIEDEVEEQVRKEKGARCCRCVGEER